MAKLNTVNAVWLAEQAIRATADQTLPHAKLVLFGSRVRGDARPRSDFDLAVFKKIPQHLHALKSVLRAIQSIKKSRFLL